MTGFTALSYLDSLKMEYTPVRVFIKDRAKRGKPSKVQREQVKRRQENNSTYEKTVEGWMAKWMAG